MNIFKGLGLLIIVSAIMLSCEKKSVNSYTIKGNLTGLPDGTKVELIPGATHKDEKPIAEANIKDGKFEFVGSVDEPRLFYIHVADSYGLGKIMVENADIDVSGKVSARKQDNGNIYNFDSINVKGSKVHDLYLQKTLARNSLDSLYTAYHENNKEISEALTNARIAKNTVLLDSLNNTDAAKKYAQDEKQFFDTVESIMTGIITSNNDTWWGPFLMLDVMSYFTPEQTEMYDAFSQQAKDSYYGQIVKAELFPAGFVGNPIPQFSLADKDNDNISLASVTSGKKYVLIDFWASWCAPCRKEIPNLKKLYTEYAPKGFEIVSISIDQKEADWIKALDEEKLPWPNYLDIKRASDAFNVKTIPAMFLIDENGVVIAEKIRGEELANKLAELFNN